MIENREPTDEQTRGPLICSGIIMGFGIGGLIDVFVMHLILQWHHTASGIIDPNSLEGLRTNIVADGILGLILVVVVLVGILLLWRSGRRRDAEMGLTTLIGSLLVGWGLFNVVDEIINHRLLGAHHLNPGPEQLVWEMGFLAASLVLIGAGVVLIQR